MKRTKTQKGITLIALIITIVVLLILAVVTINAIQGDGIVQYASNAADEYTEGTNKEKQDLNTLQAQIEQSISPEIPWKDNGDGTFSKGTTKVKIGDYVNYTYDTVSTGYPLAKAYSGYSNDQTITQSAGLQWRVMGINDKGELELICATPAKSKTVYFKDATGYNNGVYLLNDMCEKLYSNTELGIKARSLIIEDIEERFSDAGKSARDSYTISDGVQYGKTKTYGSEYNKYPTIYAEEAKSGVTGQVREGGITGSDPYYTSDSELSVAYNSSGNAVSTSKATASGNLMTTQTFYFWSSIPASYFDNETFHNMIFGTGTYYWLASRFVNCRSSNARFGLRLVEGAGLAGGSLFYSSGNSGENYRYLRPVVSLGSNVNMITNEEANSATNMWTLSK